MPEHWHRQFLYSYLIHTWPGLCQCVMQVMKALSGLCTNKSKISTLSTFSHSWKWRVILAQHAWLRVVTHMIYDASQILWSLVVILPIWCSGLVRACVDIDVRILWGQCSRHAWTAFEPVQNSHHLHQMPGKSTTWPINYMHPSLRPPMALPWLSCVFHACMNYAIA